MARSMNLTAKMTVSQAFQCIVRHCVGHIRANEAGVSVAAKWNAESLHQMRIGLRQLLTALEIFHKVQPFPDELKQELKWLEQQLSAARDWDVFSGTTLPDMADFLVKAGSDTKHLTPLMQVAKTRAQQEHSLASTVISSARYFKLMLQLNHWLFGPITQSTKNKICQNKRITLKKFSRDAIKEIQTHLVKRNKKLTDLTPKSLHRLRIATKKCRYATDFFKSLHPGKKMQEYITRITRRQDILGEHNDIVVADRLLNELQISHADLAESASFARGFLAARIKPNELHHHRLRKKLSTRIFYR